jgi:hypothetical protein
VSPLKRLTLTKLLRLLGESLAALVPFVEQAAIPWRDAEAYDEWDGIADALYNAFVESSIRDSTIGINAYPLPRYGMRYYTYHDRSRLWLYDPSGQRFVFFSFTSVAEPFDSVLCMPGEATDRISKDQSELPDPNIVIPAEQAVFELELRFPDGKSPIVIRELEWA